MQAVDDDDLPLLFKTLLKAMEYINAASLSARLRTEIARLSTSSVTLVLEVLWESLPTSKKAAEYLLRQIHVESHRDCPVSYYITRYFFLNCNV